METRLWTELTDEQSEKVVGGVGLVGSGGLQGWFGNGEPPADGTDHGLIGAGFAPPGVTKTLPSGVQVIVPGPKG